MQLEVGKIYEGKVKGITNYGAFVEVENGGTGMVHISEISNSYVNQIRDHLTENQVVKVKVLEIKPEGKVSLSIKKAEAPPPQAQRPRNNYNNNHNNNFSERKPRTPYTPPKKFSSANPPPNMWDSRSAQGEQSFEDMLSKYKQHSEERMCDIKKNVDGKRKGSSRKNTK